VRAKTTTETVLLLLAEGLTYDEIADELEINKATLHRYLTSLKERYGTKTAAGVVAQAYHRRDLLARA
jgi:DNA-binding CsgD family transcriptional regulator